MEFTAEFIRVYFNRARDDKEKVWSLDMGPGTPELLVTNVFITSDGFAVTGRTRYDSSAAEDGVRAWLELRDVVVSVDGTQVYVRRR